MIIPSSRPFSLQVRTNLQVGLRKAPEKDCSCRYQNEGYYLCSKDWNDSINEWELEIQKIWPYELEYWKETCNNDPYAPHGVKGWG